MSRGFIDETSHSPEPSWNSTDVFIDPDKRSFSGVFPEIIGRNFSINLSEGSVPCTGRFIDKRPLFRTFGHIRSIDDLSMTFRISCG
jgi:hypothetical protein